MNKYSGLILRPSGEFRKNSACISLVIDKDKTSYEALLALSVMIKVSSNAYKDEFKEHGMNVSGIYPKKGIAEIIELKNHPFFIATQAHPEFKSTLLNPHPLFVGFVKASHEHKNQRKLAEKNKAQ